MNTPTLIIGCGDTGKRVIAQLPDNKTSITAITHSASSQEKLKKLGINVITGNLDSPSSLQIIPTEKMNVFYFAPPNASGETDTRMENFINQLQHKTPPKRIVYISTTGVYGDYQGQWINEETPVNPVNERSKRRLHAERLIQNYCNKTNTEYMILRVAGIYCLEKLPIERLKLGIKILHPDLSPASNRIHADDLANICITAMNHHSPNKIFNIADGEPSSISDYFIQVAQIFELPAPLQLNWEEAENALSPAMLSYLHESKKVSFEKSQKLLGINLKYPTLKAGLQQCRALQQKNYS